ncbi:proton-coupled amino acid transporter-like protein CG1139 isoform X2 [Ostrinia nubilalis]|uniref:proton-coupled amino acid transporter-like protein CG1139 isoform X2 n=1 Tax=Ostrinia nubilalis TaxID=29057 RepID=UPI003082678C
MAAFEAVSKTTIKRLDERSSVDIRLARLPSRNPSLDDDFDPREHREPRSPIGTKMAYVNLIRSMFGAGMLGMPLAVSQLNCLNEVSRQLRIPHISYRYGFRMAVLNGPPIFRCIGNRGPALVATFMVLSQLGICTVFVTFTSDSLRDIMDWESSKPALLVLLFPYLLMEFYMTTLKIVGYVSMCGNVMNLVGLILVFYHVFKDPQGDSLTIATSRVLPVLFSFGTCLFNLSAVGVILAIDRAIVDPKVLTKKFGVIRVGITIPAAVSIVLGGLGYWSFGAMEENVLRSLPFDDPSALVAIGLYLAAVALAYPIQCTPAIHIILEVIKNRKPEDMPSDKTLKIIEVIARPTFVLMSFLVCYLIPFQAPVVAFVGNLCTTILALVFPALMELSLRYPSQYGKYKIYLIKNIAVMVIGLSSWTFGVVLCVYMIYIRLQATSPNDKS